MNSELRIYSTFSLLWVVMAACLWLYCMMTIWCVVISCHGGMSLVMCEPHTVLQDYHHHIFVWNLFNTLRPRQNGRHFADYFFKCIFLIENVSIAIKISLKFVPKGPINNIPELVQIMAWRRPGDKPLSEPMMVSLPTHICVTWPQWVN